MNIAEILENCPKGMKLYSALLGEVEFDRVDFTDQYSISVTTDSGNKQMFTSNGTYYDVKDAECLLFPSKDNRDWSTFKTPNQEFKEGDFVHRELNSRQKWISIHFATEEKKQLFLKALDERGYVWDEKKLELRKKKYEFKPFERVLVREDDSHSWIADIYSHRHPNRDVYICVGGVWPCCIPYEGNEHLYSTTNNPE